MLTCPRSILHTPGLEGWRGQKENSLLGFSSFPFLPFSWTRLLYGSLNPVCLIGFRLELISSVSPLTKDRAAEVDISKNCVCSTLLFLHQLVRSWGESHAGWADGGGGGELKWHHSTCYFIRSNYIGFCQKLLSDNSPGLSSKSYKDGFSNLEKCWNCWKVLLSYLEFKTAAHSKAVKTQTVCQVVSRPFDEARAHNLVTLRQGDRSSV